MRKRGNRRKEEKQPPPPQQLKDGTAVIGAVREPNWIGQPTAPETAPRINGNSNTTALPTSNNKLSSEEAALNAKNYRLAKELVRPTKHSQCSNACTHAMFLHRNGLTISVVVLLLRSQQLCSS